MDHQTLGWWDQRPSVLYWRLSDFYTYRVTCGFQYACWNTWRWWLVCNFEYFFCKSSIKKLVITIFDTTYWKCLSKVESIWLRLWRGSSVAASHFDSSITRCLINQNVKWPHNQMTRTSIFFSHLKEKWLYQWQVGIFVWRVRSWLGELTKKHSLISGSFLRLQLMFANYHVKKFVRKSQ